MTNTISGKIQLANGQPAAQVTIQAFFRTIIGEEKAGSPVQTDIRGYYVLNYSPNPKGNHILIKLYDKSGKHLITESDIKYKAVDKEVINVVINGDNHEILSEFEIIEQAIKNEIGHNNISLSKNEDEILKIVAENTGLKLDQVKKYYQAFLQNRKHKEVLKETFYALYRKSNSQEEDIYNLPEKTFIKIYSGAIKQYVVPASLIKQIKTQYAAYALIRDQKYSENPQTSPNITILKIAGLNNTEIGKLLQNTSLPKIVNKRIVTDWVSKGILSKDQGWNITNTVELYRLTEENDQLTTLLKKHHHEAKLLVKMDQADWVEIIKKNKITLPKYHTVETYADQLVKSVSDSYPSHRMMEKLANTDLRKKQSSIKNLQVLLKKNKRLFSKGKTTNINWEGITENEKKSLMVDLEDISKLVNKYHHLGIADIIEENTSTIDEKFNKIESTINHLKNFHENNKDVDIRLISVFEQQHNSLHTANWQNIPEAHKPLIRKQIMSYQRMLVTSNDEETRNKLLESGLDNFHSIHHGSIDEIVELTGIPRAQVSMVKKRIKEIILRNSSAFEIVRELVHEESAATRVGNLSPDLLNEFKELDGYSEIFGWNSYCGCDSCKSIFSPAAYFVDLMNYIEKNVKGIDPDHSLNLVQRRKDLWSMVLSCENTNSLIPYLTIVNEVLSSQIIEENPGEALAKTNDCLGLPFILPLEEIRIYLKQFDLSLAEIRKIVNPDSMHPENLEISFDEFKLIVSPNVENPYVLFGLSPQDTKIDLQEFIRITDLDRNEVDKLLATHYISWKEVPQIISVPGDDLQEYSEEMTELTLYNLDRMGRFIRLYKKAGWTIEELDQMLSKLKENMMAESSEPPFHELIKIKTIQQQISITIEELSGLISPLSKKQITDIFGEINFDGLAFEEKQNAIIGGLKISVSDLNFLLAQSLIKLNPIIIDNSYTSCLYRYVKLAKKLGYSIPQFNELLKLWGKFSISTTMSPNDMLDLLDFSREIRDLTFKPEKINEFLYNPINWTLDELANKLNELLSIVEVSESAIWLELSAAMKQDMTVGIEKFKEQWPEIERYFLLADQFSLSLQALKFILEDKISAVKIFHDEMNNINVKSLFKINYYKHLIIPEKKIQELNDILISFNKNRTIPYNYSTYFDANSLLLSGIHTEIHEGEIILPENVLFAFRKINNLLNTCTTLGIDANTLTLVYSDDHESLRAGSQKLHAAIKSKYENETSYSKIESNFRNKLNVLKRNALVTYILNDPNNQANGFKTYGDLYEYFLLDVEMDGCGRTSRVLAGISSLQLYIHRCLINLETSVDGKKAIIGEEIKKEWEWRKNYRVWEANRKVFLYPENYLEPNLRDNKSPEFKELENELLQQKITKESAENTYRNYLSKFSDLGRLVVSGSYFHKDEISGQETYYLFGRTNTDPYQYYLRTYEPVNSVWSSWERIDLSINAPYISAIKHLGRLYIFWIEKTITEKNNVNAGTASPGGFDIELKLVYSEMNELGKWRAPQKLPSIKALINKELKDQYETQPAYQKCYPVMYDGYIYTLIRNPIFSYGNTAYAVAHKLNLFSNRWEYEQIDYNVEIDFNPVKISDENGINSDIVSVYSIPSNSYFLNQYVDVYIDSNYKTDFGDMDYINLTKSTEIGDKKIGIKVNNAMLVHNRIEDLVVSFYERTEMEIFETKPNKEKVSLGIEVTKTSEQQFLIRQTNNEVDFRLNDSNNIFKDFKREMIHLSTGLIDQLGNIIFNDGIDKFLSIKTQEMDDYDVRPVINQQFLFAPPHSNFSLPFEGSYGNYYKELFFHIPFLIANHLNATGKYVEAKYWYEKIFNPTAEYEGNILAPQDHNWQYIDFRNQDVEKLKDILSGEKAERAIELYKKDPFNPHAIARSRLSAYPKAIVMKYVDNLLDWADSLFTQDSVESINEATMLYLLAKDILGDKPIERGKCEIEDDTFTYQRIKQNNEEASEFLIELENLVLGNSIDRLLNRTPSVNPFNNFPVLPSENFWMNPSFHENTSNNITPSENENDSMPIDHSDSSHLLAFCVPPNEVLLGYWDRVDDRLFKIRHCMDILGRTRQLSLFQPAIDPMLLVKAKAAGLSLSDILSLISTPISHYRFIYLIEKAKLFTGTLQGFGAALLSALEKKDVEELTIIRSIHEQNILSLISSTKEEQIKESKAQLNSLMENRKNITTRIEYYEMLLSEGLSGNEIAQQISKHVATTLKSIEGGLHLHSGIAYLFPQAGSVFAMTYGGKQLGDNFNAAAEWLSSLAGIADSISSSAGLEASFQRREQEWKHQSALVKQELKQLDQQIISAEIKVWMAEKDSENHKIQIEQSKELNDFYKGKFTNLGLYEYLSSTLNVLYRTAYNMAYEMALRAENAYNFELNKSDLIIDPGNWQSDKGGLLAAEKLTLQLQKLEVAYISNNARNFEITQTFSLAQLHAIELINFKKNGTCIFNIPEYAFDMVYPGQFKRFIKSVRLTIPCITGPYTNVNATLRLTESNVRSNPIVTEALTGISKYAVDSIATSSANNDAGVFELNFRDERYLPFEGAGAISTWSLELPPTFRSFDYNSITDVLIHISYTSEEGGEEFKNLVTNKLINQVKFGRVINLKTEFSNEWYEAKNKKLPLTVKIGEKFMPQYMQIGKIRLEYYLSAESEPTVLDSTDEWNITIDSLEELDELSLICIFSFEVNIP